MFHQNDKSVIFILQEDLRCYEGVPDANAGKRILNLSTLDCPSDTVPDSKYIGGVSAGGSSLTHVLLVILIILVVVVGAIVVFQNRQQLKDGVKPLVDKFQKSMEYRTIDKEEGGGEEPAPVNV